MKLRIRGNSIRLRVSKTELAKIAEMGKAGDVARFSSDRALQYGIEVRPTGAVTATFAADAILVTLPKTRLELWLRPTKSPSKVASPSAAVRCCKSCSRRTTRPFPGATPRTTFSVRRGVPTCRCAPRRYTRPLNRVFIPPEVAACSLAGSSAVTTSRSSASSRRTTCPRRCSITSTGRRTTSGPCAATRLHSTKSSSCRARSSTCRKSICRPRCSVRGSNGRISARRRRCSACSITKVKVARREPRTPAARSSRCRASRRRISRTPRG